MKHILCIILALRAYSDVPQDSEKKKIFVTAQKSVEILQEKDCIIAKGKVHIIKEDIELFSDTVTVHLTPAHTIKSIEAEGHVYVIMPERKAWSDKLTYVTKTDVIEFTGSVRVEEGDNNVKGDRLIIDRVHNKTRVLSEKGRSVSAVLVV